jgi:hypothetical protein
MAIFTGANGAVGCVFFTRWVARCGSGASSSNDGGGSSGGGGSTPRPLDAGTELLFFGEERERLSGGEQDNSL